jgi:hypothetical protein
MRWFKPNLRSSIHALFGLVHPPATAEQDTEVSIEDIREAMLALVGDVDEKQFRHVTRRIRYAIDVLALWYLRGDLMAVLASRLGEVEARQKLSEITDMFEDMLPQGLRSRPSPLNSGPGKP